MTRRAGAFDDRDRDADPGAADDVAGGGHVAEIRAPAELQAPARVLDDIAGDRHVGLRGDAGADLRVVAAG